MVTLRLSRVGSKKRPVYHLVAATKRSRRDSGYIENLGFYDPLKKALSLRTDRVQHWLSVGAEASETAKQLIARAKKQIVASPSA